MKSIAKEFLKVFFKIEAIRDTGIRSNPILGYNLHPIPELVKSLKKVSEEHKQYLFVYKNTKIKEK